MKLSSNALAAMTLALMLTAGAAAAAVIVGSPYVPVGDPVYGFLERCAARGIIPIGATTTRPMSRIEVGRLLMRVVTHFSRLDDRILEDDLDYYLREFAWDVRQLTEVSEPPARTLRNIFFNPDDALENPHRHLSMIRADRFSFIFDPVIWGRADAGEDSSGESETITRRGNGIQFRGSLDGRVGYYFRFVDHTERGHGAYLGRNDLLDDRYGYVGPLRGGNQTYYDLTEAYLASRWGMLEAVFGKDRLAWGSGREDALLISGKAPSFDHIRVGLELGSRARFTYVAGRLSPWNVPEDTLYTTDKGWVRIVPTRKWLAAHRLEYSPWEPLSLGIAEAVVWGERGFDLAYINPLNFYFSAEHNGDDRDNVLMTGDFVLRVAKRAVAYGELLVDDMKVSQLTGGLSGSKIGFLGGVWLAHSGIDGLESGIEYTRLQPYVYSHFYPVNRFSTWTSCLGSEVAPNGDRLRWRVKYRPVRPLTVDLAVDHRRHGDVGAELMETAARGSSDEVGFLDEHRREWTSLEASVGWEPKTGLLIQTGWIQEQKGTFLPDRFYLSVGYRY